MHFPPRCPGRRNGLGRPGWNGPHRRRAAPMRQACGRPRGAAPIWHFLAKLAIIRWPERSEIDSNCRRALVQQPIITPPTGAFAATQQRATANRPIIADLRQAATNLKKFKQEPSGAHPAAPAFRGSARRACAAGRACTQEAARR
ncbi:hypothetical protein A8F26_06780 [Burkholderia cenocepacia]|nr:hypothetical protein BURCENK562V_C1873 [Burkholderia cenocepacia K56-2Valvano]ERI27502.1 hypothetical protein BURCENBC7_AP6350 [Burkholderia cenocepacia BC7]MDR8068345.1 hypothetical protein [Burkholderia cenocepacia]ONX53769.1 hypothetical protein A8F14_39145 [Burkholderia cenocepacia]ONX57215.1 hypothetical protein A8F17_33900 [Burkholderia cenocepacia]